MDTGSFGRPLVSFARLECASRGTTPSLLLLLLFLPSSSSVAIIHPKKIRTGRTACRPVSVSPSDSRKLWRPIRCWLRNIRRRYRGDTTRTERSINCRRQQFNQSSDPRRALQNRRQRARQAWTFCEPIHGGSNDGEDDDVVVDGTSEVVGYLREYDAYSSRKRRVGEPEEDRDDSESSSCSSSDDGSS